MGKIRQFLRQNFFPQDYTCEICGIEIFSGRLCPKCAAEFVPIDGAACPVCGRKTAVSEICIECKAHLPQFKRAVSAFCYDGSGSKLIARFKHGKTYLADYLSELLKPHIASLPAADGIVYVPMTKKALKKRGYNQSLLLAKRISEYTGTPVLNDAVVKIKETADQKALSREERSKNLSACFEADKKIVGGKTVLVVDDVLTTGATLDAVAFKLKKAGAKEVYAATAASVEYRCISKDEQI